MAKILKLKRSFPLLTLLIAMATLTLGTARLSWADSVREEMGDFHHFLSEHPRIASDLQRDPSLANNSRYLHDHDTLRDFLHAHPQVRREIAANPARAMGSSGWNSGRYGNYRGYEDRPWYWPWGRR
jgi:hypothetical protein